MALATAAAVAATGGALAVRAARRQRAGPPATPRPVEPPAPEPDPPLLSRWSAPAIGAAIAVLIVAVLVGVAIGSSDTAPVPLGGVLTVTSQDDGARAEVDLRRLDDSAVGSAALSAEAMRAEAGRRVVLAWLHVRNTGRVPFPAGVDRNARLIYTDGGPFARDRVLPAVNQEGPPPTLDAGDEAELAVAFLLPPGAEPARLQVTMLGRSAEWSIGDA